MKVWTFDIKKGRTIFLEFPGNPPLEHDGRHTLWHMVGDEKLAQTVEDLVAALGCEVARYGLSQTEAEKNRLMAGD